MFNWDSDGVIDSGSSRLVLLSVVCCRLTKALRDSHTKVTVHIITDVHFAPISFYVAKATEQMLILAVCAGYTRLSHPPK